MTALELRPLATLCWLSANYDLILETRCRTKASPLQKQPSGPQEKEKRGFSSK